MTCQLENDLNNQLAVILAEITDAEKERLALVAKIDRLTVRKEQLIEMVEKCRWSRLVHRAESELDDVKTNNILDYLRIEFGLVNFRNGQVPAINASLAGRDAMVVMPTGGGKSLIYQMVAVVKQSLVVVISPLLSLIQDQMRAANSLDSITSGTLNSTMTKVQKDKVVQALKDGAIKMLFVTPETVLNPATLGTLKQVYNMGNLAHFVIDEVHCIVSWGHDFRPEYHGLSLLRSNFPGVPIMGLTATATPKMVMEIANILRLPEPIIIRTPFVRENLFYKVRLKPQENFIDMMAAYIKMEFPDQCGIIYSATCRECELVATVFRTQHNIKAAPYSGNLDNTQRTRIQEKWYSNQYQVVIATQAFGMGIDKKDVRFVIHMSTPKTIENYYQECGRAGRDGKPATCILYFSLDDWMKNYAYTRSEHDETRVKRVLEYSTLQEICRKRFISTYFDDEWTFGNNCAKCDVCVSPKQIYSYEVALIFKRFLSVIGSFPREMNVTYKKFIDNLFRRNQKVEDYPKYSKETANIILGQLLLTDRLKVERGYNAMRVIPGLAVGDADGPSDTIPIRAPQLPGVPLLRVDENEDVEPSTSQALDLADESSESEDDQQSELRIVGHVVVSSTDSEAESVEESSDEEDDEPLSKRLRT